MFSLPSSSSTVHVAPTHAWDRHPWDTDTTWEWFREYLVLPRPRTLDKLRRLGAPFDTLELGRIAHDGLWRERAALYDAAQVAAAEEAVAKGLRDEMRRKWDRIDRFATSQLAKLARSADETPAASHGLREVTRLLEVSSRMRLEIEGLPPDPERTPDYSVLTDEELRELRRLTRKLERG